MSIIWIRVAKGYDAWLWGRCDALDRIDGKFVGLSGVDDDGYAHVTYGNGTLTSLPERFLELVQMDDDFENAISVEPFTWEGLHRLVRKEPAIVEPDKAGCY